MDYKIEQVFLRIKNNAEENKKQDLIEFENGILRINKNRSEANWFILFYLIFLILTPIGILIYSIIATKDLWFIGIFIMVVLSFVLSLKKIIIGATTLEINFSEKYFQTENNTLLFKQILKSKKINFTDVVRSELNEKTIHHKYSKTSRWLQLSVIDKKGIKHILTDFDSDNIIASDVQKIIYIIISDNKLLNKK